MTAGFSVWPIRAVQSPDFTFLPDGGIAGKSRRRLDSWGLDVKSFSSAGAYRFGFAIDGPQGHGEGHLPDLTVLDRPGPPPALSWLAGSLPVRGLDRVSGDRVAPRPPSASAAHGVIIAGARGSGVPCDHLGPGHVYGALCNDELGT